MSAPDRAAEVLACLDHVTDPELDEPVTKLGFVTAVTVDPDGVVTIAFRLPTYWCAANFAFMMADDMRREVSALPWVTRVEPRLGEHMYTDKINDGVARGLSFQDTFGEAADGDLDQLRRTFLIKAFQRRQEALLQNLCAAGMQADALASLRLHALRGLALDGSGETLRARYLERRAVAGPAAPDDYAFVDAEGRMLVAAELPAYLRRMNRIGVGAEFNGALCRGLLAARFGEIESVAPGEPKLHDFVRAAAGGATRPGRAA